jgi:4-hydroxyproline epimerase
MAQLVGRGRLAVGERFVHESIIGSQFTGCVESATQVGHYEAVIPSIEGWARIYGENVITVDPNDDPFWAGFCVT